jgi:CubicO group peptidase (beta-lactamase class C family)
MTGLAPSRRVVRAGLASAAALPARALDGPTLAEVARRAAAMEQRRALVIARDGEIVFAEAFRGPGLERPFNVRSVSKMRVAAIAGAAFDRGLPPGPEAPLIALVPPPQGADARVARITLDHLLTVRGGLDRTSGRNYGVCVQSRNWVAHALTRLFVDAPGGRFLYPTGSFHLLGVALARDWLGKPLGVEFPARTRDPQGCFMGGNQMALSPMALVRFGEMIRLGGVWQGRLAGAAGAVGGMDRDVLGPPARARRSAGATTATAGSSPARTRRASPTLAATAGRCSVSCPTAA